MKPKTMILMGLAITCGLGASWMTSRLLAGRQTEEVETVTILVAKQAINVGDLLKKPEEVFAPKVVAADAVPDGAVKDFDGLKDKIMRKSLRKGDHITASEMYGAHEQLEIPDGHVAVGMKVNIETAVSGFASLPRSRVDVLMTVIVNNRDINLSFVQVLLEDVLVLAADTDTTRDKGIVVQAAVVTLALNPDDAKRVTGGKVMGELSLVLRKPGDHSRTERPVMTFMEIKHSKNSNDVPSYSIAPPPDVATTKGLENAPKADYKPQDVQPVVEPKLTTKTLVIVTGTRQDKTHFHYTEDGRLVEGDDDVNAPPTPSEARPQASPGSSPSRIRKNSGPQDY